MRRARPDRRLTKTQKTRSRRKGAKMEAAKEIRARENRAAPTWGWQVTSKT